MNLPERPLSSNFTTPSIREKRVSSLPRPTLFPGFHLVPRCRAMMLPPTTRSPPNFFKPSRWDCESRPFRDEPTPFLCAILDFRSSILDFRFDESGHNVLVQKSQIKNHKSKILYLLTN